MVKNLSDSNYQSEVMEKDGVSLVDFYADWCGPCKMQAPIIEELDAEMSDKVKFYKVNVDDNPDVAEKLSIASIPSLVLYKDGELKFKFVGYSTANELRDKLNELLN
ncbi:MAG: thioredoxin [Christensenellaceae bacterium]